MPTGRHFLEAVLNIKVWPKNKWQRVIKLIVCDVLFTKLGMELEEMLGEQHSVSKAWNHDKCQENNGHDYL